MSKKVKPDLASGILDAPINEIDMRPKELGALLEAGDVDAALTYVTEELGVSDAGWAVKLFKRLDDEAAGLAEAIFAEQAGEPKGPKLSGAAILAAAKAGLPKSEPSELDEVDALDAAREALESVAEELARRPAESNVDDDTEARDARKAVKKGGGVLDPGKPREVAKAFLGMCHYSEKARCSRLHWWRKDFWEWSKGRWAKGDWDTVKSELYTWLEASRVEVNTKYTPDLDPNQTIVNKVMDAVWTRVNLKPSEYEMPGWLVGKPPEGVENIRELVAVKNGLLYLPTRQLFKHTPRFFSPNVMDFRYEATARCPLWLKFIGEVWPGDRGAWDGLQELFGLCLTDETRYHVGFMFTGPRRGGRGTIGRVLTAMVGKENVVGTSLREMADSFGLAPLLGKKVVIFSDEDLKGLGANPMAVLTTRLKKLTGEDRQTVNEKNKKIEDVLLTARPVIFSNKVIKFGDSALNGRMIDWEMKVSFKGREDFGLTDKLLGELPGILNWALDGLDRLRARGKLVQHASGNAMAVKIELDDDMADFLQERCQRGEGKTLAIRLFAAWKVFCRWRAVEYGLTEASWSKKFREATGLKSNRPSSGNPARLTTFHGVRLRPEFAEGPEFAAALAEAQAAAQRAEEEG